MEILDYQIPPFKTEAWVNDNARTVWYPRFKKISEAVIFMVVKAIQDKTIQHQSLVVEGWMYFKILELTSNLKINVDSTFLGNKQLKGPIYYEIELSSQETSGKEKKEECCKQKSLNLRTENRKEYIYESALKLTSQQENPFHLKLSSDFNKSVFWQRLIATLGYQHRCSLNCKHQRINQDITFNLLQKYGYIEEFNWLKEIYSWPLSWNANHGICELRTPIVKLAFDTDSTAYRYTLDIDGTSYPEEGAPGNRFPYRQRSFLRISDSKSFKAGLQHGT